ncbi:unnamed protein product [Phytophthora fragariaefolia]|uniref:Unnamed protein product n=1 Tax=Phytophthora fragariaefolia TaxID=1490495 RepID=A0A9W6YNF2_9STRA|nr:unnamed protein product [Phytophthora fragariaefolia]
MENYMNIDFEVLFMPSLRFLISRPHSNLGFNMTSNFSSGKHCQRVAVLVVVTLLACIHVSSAEVQGTDVVSNSETLYTFKTDNYLVSDKRSLRADTFLSTSQHAEQRALAVSLPGIDQIISSIKAGVFQVIQKLRLKWWGMRNKSPDYVFTHLKLDQTGSKLFESREFSKWVAFVTARNPKEPESIIFSTLKSHYTDEALATMLVAAKQAESTTDFATKLQRLQLSYWAAMGKSDDEVYRLLRLDRDGDGTPLFNVWASYVSTNTKDPSEIIIAISGQYGDVALARMIMAATTVESTEILAADLRTALFMNWVSQGASPKEVDSKLHLTTYSDELTKKVSRDFEKFYGKIKVVYNERSKTRL